MAILRLILPSWTRLGDGELAPASYPDPSCPQGKGGEASAEHDPVRLAHAVVAPRQREGAHSSVVPDTTGGQLPGVVRQRVPLHRHGVVQALASAAVVALEVVVAKRLGRVEQSHPLAKRRDDADGPQPRFSLKSSTRTNFLA